MGWYLAKVDGWPGLSPCSMSDPQLGRLALTGLQGSTLSHLQGLRQSVIFAFPWALQFPHHRMYVDVIAEWEK